MILKIFPAMRMGLSCSWRQLFAVGSTTEVNRSRSKKDHHAQCPH